MKSNPHGLGAEPARRPGAAPRDDAGASLVVHPGTGEVLGTPPDLEQLPPELLADAFVALRDREKQMRAMRDLVDHELVRRLDTRDKAVWVLGDYEVSIEAKRESVWDADELEQVVRDLIDQGVVEAGEVTGLIRHETTVSRRAGQQLIARLSGKSKRAVEACRTFQTAGKRRLDVVRSISLFEPPA